MKKYILSLFVFLFIFGFFLFPNLSLAQAYPPGCTSAQGYSSTTGLSCSANRQPIFWLNKQSLMANALSAVNEEKPKIVNNGGAQPQPVLAPVVADTSSCSISMTLSKGMNNGQVKCLQQKLNEKGFKVAGVSVGGETTFFGYNTLLAVKKFQTSKNLVVDGVVRASTRAALN